MHSLLCYHQAHQYKKDPQIKELHPKESQNLTLTHRTITNYSISYSQTPFQNFTEKAMSTGLDRLQLDPKQRQICTGNIGYLCHSASVDKTLRHGADIMRNLFGSRLKALFGPQHGLNTDAQDNMIESLHFEHPIYKIPVFSLYSDTREPTPEMLSHIDTLVIDLQDVGVRVYTYIWTMVLAMKACDKAGKNVVILDRPNPLNGTTIEGNISKQEFSSFVGLHPLPMRHGMSIGEIARFAVAHWDVRADITVIETEGWDRTKGFESTGLPWVPPSPNLSSTDTLSVYPGFVLFEGTKLSEGRGTVRPFEIIGHPKIKHISWQNHIQSALDEANLRKFRVRPHTFVPTFEKWENTNCYGYQIHLHTPKNPVQKDAAGSWLAAQIVMRELFNLMGDDFGWRPPPFEYENDNMPIDILNGSDEPRKWIERNGSTDELREIESTGIEAFLARREEIIR